MRISVELLDDDDSRSGRSVRSRGKRPKGALENQPLKVEPSPAPREKVISELRFLTRYLSSPHQTTTNSNEPNPKVAETYPVWVNRSLIAGSPDIDMERDFAISLSSHSERTHPWICTHNPTGIFAAFDYDDPNPNPEIRAKLSIVEKLDFHFRLWKMLSSLDGKNFDIENILVQFFLDTP
jgi:hypothetical protein